MPSPEKPGPASRNGHAKHRAAGRQPAPLVTHPATAHARRRRNPWPIALLLVLVVAGGGWLAWQLGGQNPADSDASDPRSGDHAGAAATRTTVTTIAATGTARVRERLSFEKSQDSLVLANPDRTSLPGSLAPAIRRLWVDTGAGRRSVDDVPAPGDSVRVSLPKRVTEVRVGYVATDVLAPSGDSAPGRALALVTPLRVGPPGATGSMVIRGLRVDNLGCVPPSGTMSACGTRSGSGWTVTTRAGDPVDVLAQLTLTHR